jgi:hypothetical protein
MLAPGRVAPVQFGLYSGRVVMTNVRISSFSTSSMGGGRTERISIGDNKLCYESASRGVAGEHLWIEAVGPDQLSIRHTLNSGAMSVKFEQTARGPVTLTVGPKDHPQIYRGASLWHLWIAERGACRTHLSPLFALLNHQWDLAKTGDQVEEALLSTSAPYELCDHKHWAELVEQLGDDRFFVREAADRQLRSLGRVAVGYLRRLDVAQLDAEQRYRVRRIIHALSAVEDTHAPDEIAAWLSVDPAVWLALLEREAEPVRRLAALRLQALLGRTIPFDPAACAGLRRQQLETLRASVPGT